MKYQERMNASLIRNIAAVIILLAVFMMISVSGLTDRVYADDETTYSIFVYSGQEGYFGKPEVTMKKVSGLKYGESVTVSLKDYDLTIKDPEKYYVRGLKIAGHDNDQLSSMQFQSYTFRIKEDVAFSVAYGMAGGMVKYTVKYQDEDDKALLEDEEFYGMAGDMPVVAFRKIDGYKPNDYNLTKTLTDDENENVFIFTYHKVTVPDENGENGEGEEKEGNGDEDEEDECDEEGDEGDEGDNGGNGGNNGANNQTGIYFGGEGSGAEDGPEDEITNLDENKTPTTDGDGSENAEKEKKGSGISAGAVAGIAGVIAFALLMFLFFHKKNNSEA